MTHLLRPEAIGFIAGIFTTFASLPQIANALKTRSMNDISLATLCMLTFGITLWMLYGIALHSPSIILWNVISLCLFVAQISLKLFLQMQSSRQPWPAPAEAAA